MSIFDDVCNNYIEIIRQYKKLYVLLIAQLKKYAIDIEENTSFKDLIHAINDIESKEYNIFDNIMPSTTFPELDETDYTTYIYSLADQTRYYISWIRYYLAKKGVSLESLNNAKTLEAHIALMDFIDIIKPTELSVTLNNDDTLYYGTNRFYITVINKMTGEPVTEGDILLYKDDSELPIIYSLTDVIYIEEKHLDRHQYVFQYRGTENYKDSNIVGFDKIVQPMPISFNPSLTNTINRQYLDQTESLKGYIDDEWNIHSYMTNIFDEQVYLPIIIKIYDPEREIETTDEFTYTTILLHNNENNNQPIKLTIEPKENIYYTFDNTLFEFYINVLYPYWQINPEYDYTGKQQYQFEITFYDELTGENNNTFNNESINIYISNGDELIFDIDTLINNNSVVFWYNNNLLISTYIIEWEMNDIQDNTEIDILPNVEYPQDTIYLNDEPQIKILNLEHIQGLIIAITKEEELYIIEDEEENIEEESYITEDEEENTEENIEEISTIYFNGKIDTMYYCTLGIDENGILILPDEYKEVGTYYVRMENNITNEEFEFEYTIEYPYTYESEILEDRAVFYINIYDTEDFDFDNITDYIKICEYGIPLEYEYTGDIERVTIVADKYTNPRFKGINTFYIDINDYIETERFTLLEENEGLFEVIGDIELGENDVNIACYDDEVNQITVIITHNGTTIGTHTVNSNTENFIFTETFPEFGDYIFTITGNEITETYTITVNKSKLKIQEFQIANSIDPDDTNNENNYLGFGFAEGNKISEDINIIFYCDIPQNILTTKTINAQDTEYHTYNIFLGNDDIEPGKHTIYASFDGNSTRYQEFLVSKEFYKLSDTRIVYDEEIDTILLGDSIDLFLLTIDSSNNIVNKGYYIINGEEYGLNERIRITPIEITSEFNINVQYIGEDEYKNSMVNIKYIVNPGEYNYYASSLTGNNENDGLTPATAVIDIDTLFELSQSEDDLFCLMEGTYTKDTISRTAIFYGYHLDDKKDIKVNINKLAPNTRLVLNNVSLNTGDGYTTINGFYEFVNSGDEVIELSAIPGSYIDVPISETNIYDIEIDNPVYAYNSSTIITGTTLKNELPVANKLIKIYKGNQIIKACMSDSNGEFRFKINTTENMTLRISTNNVETNINVVIV